MSFWPVFRRQRSSLNEILEKDDFTLEELLDQEDIVQECRYLNDGLLDYLSQPEVVERLIKYVVTVPDVKEGKGGPDESGPSRYPYIASELFECGIGAMQNVLFEKPELLGLLFSVLEKKPPLDPSHVAYFRKVVSVLIQRKFEDLTEYMRESERGQKILGNMLEHIGLHSILELFNLITWDDGERAQPSEDHINWLVEQKLIPRLIGKLDPKYEKEPEVHANAAQALVDAALRAPVDHPGIEAVFSDKEMISQLFKYMLSGNDSSLQHSLSAVIALIQRHLKIHAASDEDEFLDEQKGHEEDAKASSPGKKGRTPKKAGEMKDIDQVAAMAEQAASPAASAAPAGGRKPPGPPPPLSFQDLLIKNLMELVKLLRVEPKTSVTTLLETTCRFGPSRLKLVELLLWALRTHDPVLEQTLIELKALPILLDLFQAHEWHNMLHIRVANIVEAILDGQSLAVQRSLFTDCKILERIISMSRRNDFLLQRAKGTRAGFMGHVVHMANSILDWHKEVSTQPIEAAGEAPTKELAELKEIRELVTVQMDSKDWRRYVDTSLFKDNEKMQVQLGGQRPGERQQLGEEPGAEGQQTEEDDDDELFNFEDPEIEDPAGSAGGPPSGVIDSAATSGIGVGNPMDIEDIVAQARAAKDPNSQMELDSGDDSDSDEDSAFPLPGVPLPKPPPHPQTPPA